MLDVSHWLHYCQLLAADPLTLLEEFPMAHVVELHVSGGTRTDAAVWYEEEHSADLLPECLALLECVATRAPALRAVTVECHAAPVDTIVRSLQAVARLPAVVALRARVGGLDRSMPAPSNEGSWPVQLSTSLTTPGPELLRQRETAVREWLEDPRSCERWDSLAEAERVVFAAVPGETWRAAVARTCRRLFDAELFARVVLDRVYGDMAIPVRKWFDAQPTGEVEPSVEAVLAFVIEDADVPGWARDCLRFHLDSDRIKRGLPPFGPFINGPQAGSFVIRYGTPVLRTLKALARRTEPPPARSTEHLFMSTPGDVSVRELPSST